MDIVFKTEQMLLNAKNVIVLITHFSSTKRFQSQFSYSRGSEDRQTIVTSHSATSSKPTAVVQVQSKRSVVSLRGLLDFGSLTSFITDNASQKLQLPKQCNATQCQFPFKW